jgi:hypothetical protein
VNPAELTIAAGDEGETFTNIAAAGTRLTRPRTTFAGCPAETKTANYADLLAADPLGRDRTSPASTDRGILTPVGRAPSAERV